MCENGRLQADVVARVRETGFAEVERRSVPVPVDAWLRGVASAAAELGVEVAFVQTDDVIEIVDVGH